VYNSYPFATARTATGHGFDLAVLVELVAQGLA
jgi:hypothetical protein